MTVSSIAAGASEAVLLWFERGRCLEARLPLAALSVCRPLRRNEYFERPPLYAIDFRREETPSLPRVAEPDDRETVVARIG
jgi:hypothetical protein